MEIYCRNINRYLPLQGGETLAEILAHTPELAEMAQKERPICARVNNKTEPLQFQVFGPKMVEYLPRTSGSGERVYISFPRAGGGGWGAGSSYLPRPPASRVPLPAPLCVQIKHTPD